MRDHPTVGYGPTRLPERSAKWPWTTVVRLYGFRLAALVSNPHVVNRRLLKLGWGWGDLLTFANRLGYWPPTTLQLCTEESGASPDDCGSLVCDGDGYVIYEGAGKEQRVKLQISQASVAGKGKTVDVTLANLRLPWNPVDSDWHPEVQFVAKERPPRSASPMSTGGRAW